MGKLIGAYVVSHTAMIIRKYDPDNPRQKRVHQSFAALRDEIKEKNPDVIVVVGSEHMQSLFYDNYPQYLIVVSDEAEGAGDAGIPSRKVNIASDFAKQLLEIGIESGFDFSWSANIKLDHGFMMPLELLTPEMNFPIVPIFQNACTPPLPTFKRSAQLGDLIRKVIDERPEEERVLIIGTGGLSHWVGVPKMGHVNEEFDKKILTLFENGDLESLTSLTTEEVMEEAGNGAQEIRNWVTVMKAAESKAEVILYEPVHEWATGISLAKFPTGSEQI